MTSVLNSGGLNYQANNPLRIEILRIRNDILDVRSIIDTQKADIALLKAQLAVSDKKIKELSTAATAATAAAPAANVTVASSAPANGTS